MKKILGYSLTVLFLTTGAGIKNTAHGEETTGEKIENKMGDVKTSAKKTYRKAKREVRKATGNDNVMKDVKDKAQDAGDDIKNEAEKAKKRVD